MTRYLLKRQVLVLLFLFIALNLFSQTFVEQTSITLPGVSNGSVAWGDYNNDGYLDIILTGRDENSGTFTKIYRNNGDNTFTEQTSILLPGVSNGSLVWGDYNNDGNLDILLTGNYASGGGVYLNSRIYRNNGDNTFTEQTSISLTGITYASVAWCDYDNDGNLDILLSGTSFYSSELISKVYRNNGDNTFTEQTNISLPGVSNSYVAWGDYDNDGYPDILLTGWTGSEFISKVYRNNGNNTYTEQTGIKLTGVSAGSVAWGDYDNDGYLDILLTGNNGSRPITKIYRNNGNNSFTEQTGISLTGVMYSYVAWGDYDNDGDLDILLTGNSSYGPVAKIYRNNGNNTFTEQTSIQLTGVDAGSDAWGDYRNVAWGDYDNDGDLDILLTGLDANGNPISKIYRNDCTIINKIPDHPKNFSYQIQNKNVLLHWDRVTTDETSSKSLTYNIRIGRKSGTSEFASSQSTLAGLRKVADMGNKQLDTAFIFKDLRWDTTYFASVQAIDNSFKGGSFSNEVQFKISPIQPTQINADHINNNSLLLKWKRGNGDRCIIFAKVGTSGTANPQNGITYYANSVFGEGSPIGVTGWYCIYKGEADSLFLSGLYQQKNYIIDAIEFQGRNGSEIYDPTSTLENMGTFSTGLFTEQTGISLTAVYLGSVVWGDYDNDGYLDILLTGSGQVNYSTKIYHNNGDNTFTEQTSISLSGVSNSSVAWGDYDNDGYLDILITGNSMSGPISKLYKNNGNNSFTEQTGISLTGVVNSSVDWGDYNNDGYLDILLTGDSGPIQISKIYRNNGNNTFTELTETPITGISHGSVAWGDYDNDGDLDILLTGHSSYGSIAKIYRNNGDNTFTEQTSIQLTGVDSGTAAWGDYNNDGYKDILLTGNGFSKVYRNNGNNTFSDQTGILLSGVYANSAAWGDCDNDGFLDILWTGSNGTNSISTIYHNNGDNTFTEETDISLTGLTYSSVAWGDYDNDGDLDIILTGKDANGFPNSKVFRNNLIMKAGNIKSNNKPGEPVGLADNLSPGKIKLSWAPVYKDETPTKTMSYNLRYKLKESVQWRLAPDAANDGFRHIAAMGNIQLNNSFTLKNLHSGTYYWQVQAVDQVYSGGAWSAVDSFVVKNVQAFFKTDTVCFGLATHFFDQSIATDGIASRKWDFKDGTNSTQQNPSHLFTVSGTYYVKLVVTSTGGVKDSLEQNLIVKSKPLTGFTATTVCQGATTTITNTTNNNGLTISSWYWNFGD